MDLYWDKTYIEEQKIAFIQQIQWAKKLDLPIAIHARDAFNEIFEILDKENDASLKGVFHCFSGSAEEATEILKLGFKLGIGGVITYKNSSLPEILKGFRIEDIVLETDSPYLPPVPYRGKRNESAYLLHVAERLAEVKHVTLKQVENITSQNARPLFQL